MKHGAWHGHPLEAYSREELYNIINELMDGNRNTLEHILEELEQPGIVGEPRNIIQNLSEESLRGVEQSGTIGTLSDIYADNLSGAKLSENNADQCRLSQNNLERKRTILAFSLFIIGVVIIAAVYFYY